MKNIVDVVNEMDEAKRAHAQHCLRGCGCYELADALGELQARELVRMEVVAALEKANDRVARLENVIAKMRASVRLSASGAEVERDNAVEAVGKLQEELVQAKARIAELEMSRLGLAQIP
jgi:hypothetical protein